jgi:hypothetical protein
LASSTGENMNGCHNGSAAFCQQGLTGPGGQSFTSIAAGSNVSVVIAGNVATISSSLQHITRAGTFQTNTVIAGGTEYVRGGILRRPNELELTCPVAGLVASFRGADCLPYAGATFPKVAGVWPGRTNGHSILAENATVSPRLNSDFCGRQEIICDPVGATGLRLQANALVDWFNRINNADDTNDDWSAYIRLRFAYKAGFNIALGAISPGARDLGIGFYHNGVYCLPVFSCVGNVTFLDLTRKGYTTSYCWSASDRDQTLRHDGYKSPTAGFSSNAGGAFTRAAICDRDPDGTAVTGFEFVGAIQGAAFFDRNLTDAEYVQVDDWFCSDYRAKVIIEGNSLSAGGETWGSMAEWLERYLGPSVRIENYAIGGQQTAAMLAAMPSVSIPRIRAVATMPSVVFIWEFSNSINAGIPLANVQADTVAAIALVLAAGGLPLLATVLPRVDMSVGEEAIRVAFNAWLLLTYPAITANLTASDRLDSYADALYFNAADQVHLTDLGCSVGGAIIAAKCRQAYPAYFP